MHLNVSNFHWVERMGDELASGCLAFTLADCRDPSHISPDFEGRLFWTVDASMLRNILPRLWLVNCLGSTEPARLISAARE